MSDFLIHRGVNISHWLSQSRLTTEERFKYFTRDDVRRIAGWGLDHIRLPIDESVMWDEDGERQDVHFDLMNQALDWCEVAGVRVIVDLHILRSHYFNSDEEPTLYNNPRAVAKWCDLWRDLSAFMRGRALDQLAYETLNEPVARDPRKWNEVYPQALKAIRETEPQRLVLVGSNGFQSPRTFDTLEVPDDPHQMLSVHFYFPMFVTHYKARWTPTRVYDGPIQYPGRPVPEEGLKLLSAQQIAELDAWHDWNRPADRDMMRDMLSKPLALREETGLPLHCGEFGVNDNAPRDIQVAWLRDIISVFDELSVPYSIWDYKGSFGVLTKEGEDKGLVPIVAGKA